MRWTFNFLVLLMLHSCRDRLTVEKFREISDYASGSGIAFFERKIYIAGDDMNYVLLTDTAFNSIDTLQLLPGNGRIPKNEKADLEGITIIRRRKVPYLLLLGSGSVAETRSKGWTINLRKRQSQSFNLDTFYRRLLTNGVREINIEGCATAPGGLVLANRGNKAYPKNHLIFTSGDFWERQESSAIRIIKLGASEDTSTFAGVSGIEYSQRSDRLIMTVSTENTYSTSADGAIGKSYLWIVDNISSKRRLTAMNPDRIIDLETIDPSFRGHKVESVCILSETRTSYQLALVADDDKGTSLLFKINLNKKSD